MSASITVAAIQDSFSTDMEENCARMQARVAEAAARGAQVVLPPELFQGHYFCQRETGEAFRDAHPADRHPAVKAMQEAAKRHHVVIPTSFFEEDGPHYYNSLALIEADGSIAGVYRKSHIPTGPGYEEKFYFRPGNTGFRVWPSAWGTLGVGICWDQWFPETARALTLLGADVLFFPTAIGSEPEEPDFDTARPWQRAMLGHAVCNVIPVVAANRIGNEEELTFYGSSFIADHRGEKLAEANREAPAVLVQSFDLDQIREDRATMGFFRDRRPELYQALADS